jgi:acyl phosphate:glycerol-3-phosphate acyltransferase
VNEVVAALVGYGIGSLPLGFLLTRSKGVDLRRVGSGNIGATNVYRSAGAALAIAVMILDIAKGATAVVAARALTGDGTSGAIAGFSAVVGHVYPVWLNFVGGKGVAVACGSFAVLAPIATAAAAVTFVVGTWLSRYVSLGSILASLTLPAVGWLRPGQTDVDIASTLAAALILFRHRGNLRRLIDGTERRLGERAPVNS